MEHGGEPGRSAEMFFVGAKSEQGFSGGAKESGIGFFLMCQDKVVQQIGQSEHDVKIFDGQRRS